eukprot:3821470-Amphidinium_carterae.1
MQPHEVLGVPVGAPVDAVRAAYKRAALESHPDKGGTKDSRAQVFPHVKHNARLALHFCDSWIYLIAPNSHGIHL